jgi:hypothetical protein
MHTRCSPECFAEWEFAGKGLKRRKQRPGWYISTPSRAGARRFAERPLGRSNSVVALSGKAGGAEAASHNAATRTANALVRAGRRHPDRIADRG